ncbi:MAG: class I SAM-dependent RNA methyltransferase [Chloroflexi bacterium]|nr:class I SAM-dependent RNA methyltransferase [Chloroflexota bacterium]
MAVAVKLRDIAYGGAAVGRLDDGAAVFVPGGLPGELVTIELTERKKNFARGRLVEVVEPAEERIAPPCRHFVQGCGGCQWQHAGYDAQLAYKQRILADQLRRFGSISEPPLLDPVPSPNPFHYRNVAEFHVTDKAIGFNREGSHDVVDVYHCPLTEAPIDAALQVLRKERHKLAGIEQVQIRTGEDALQLSLLAADDPRAFKLVAAELAEAIGGECRVAGVRAGSASMRGLHGEPWIHKRLADRSFRVSALSFFQVHAAVSEQLAAIVASHFPKGGRVLDLFSGVGTFAILAADAAEEVVAVEEHPAAIADARANLAEAAADNVRLVQSDVAASAGLAAERWDLAILDPPRVGCPRAVLEAIDAACIVYVSCDPSTLARDLKALVARGYRLSSVRLLDMFPQTYHLETVAVLEL